MMSNEEPAPMEYSDYQRESKNREELQELIAKFAETRAKEVFLKLICGRYPSYEFEGVRALIHIYRKPEGVLITFHHEKSLLSLLWGEKMDKPPKIYWLRGYWPEILNAIKFGLIELDTCGLKELEEKAKS